MLSCVLVQLLHCLVCVCRFDRLQLQCLEGPIHSKYVEILLRFSAEIDCVQKVQIAARTSPCVMCDVAS